MTSPVGLGLSSNLGVITYQKTHLLDSRRVSVSIDLGLLHGMGHTFTARKS